MQRTISDAAIARVLGKNTAQIDRNLPEWARRTNPIVRRHLAEYWKVTPSEFSGAIRAIGIQLAIVFLTFLFPFLLSFIMPAVTISLVLLPMGLYMHAAALYHIARRSADWVADERNNNSLDLLRVSPRPMIEILASKIAASIWRQSENLSLIIVFTAYFSMPLLVIQWDSYFAAAREPVLMRLGVGLAIIVSVVRLPLEAAMVGTFGALGGAASRWKPAAQITAQVLAIAYFTFINLIRLLPWEGMGRLTVEIILPVALPLVLITLCLRGAARMLERSA